VAVYVQALAETHAIVETVQVGNFTYVNTGARGKSASQKNTDGEQLDTLSRERERLWRIIDLRLV